MENENSLLERVSKLIKENRRLKEQIENCNNTIDDLTEKNETLELKGVVNKSGNIKHYKMVTVLIVEFFGFSTIANKNNSTKFIDELDNIYFNLKKISKKHNVEKIRTIGDVYMCVGGVPNKNTTNSIDIILAALDMREYIQKIQQIHKEKGEEFWSFKMGIHTGEVTAINNGYFTLKGETVDITSRVKSIAYKGQINISAMTYELVKEYFICEYKNLLPVKYKKNYEVYNVTKIKKAYSVNREGDIPNNIFETKYKLRQLTDLQEIILDKLEKELPKYLFYHNVKHTIDVLTQVELIGVVEGVTDYELLILKTAALFHDIGQIHQSKGHEAISCEYAKKILPQYGYLASEIEAINSIIMATEMPPKPKTLLQKIICDADLDYLGRTDFIPVSDTLYKELKEQNIISDINTWNKMQVSFLESHQYFTNSAKKLRQVNKQEQINRLKGL